MTPVADRYNLIAFLSIIGAILALALISGLLHWLAPDDPKLADALQVFGLAISGLIGIAGTFKPRSGGEEQAGKNLAVALDKMPAHETNGSGEPQPVEVVNEPGNPVPTTDEPAAPPADRPPGTSP